MYSFSLIYFYARKDFDILVTNPPYSGEHKQRLLTYLQNRRVLKPFALLLPAYTVTKSYWRDFVTFVENKSKKANAGLASSCFMYILPPVSYNYEHPDGTGHKIPPFYSAWLLGGFPNMHRCVQTSVTFATSVVSTFLIILVSQCF